MTMQNSNQMPDSIFVFGLSVDQQAAREFAINLFDWSRNNAGRGLRINLNSGGGNIQNAMFLYESFGQLRALGHHLTIAVSGRAASCAAWLVQAADVRIIGSVSEFLIHEVSSAVDGTLSDIRRELERCTQLQNKTFDLLCSRSNLTHEQIHTRVDGGIDWWISAKEALELGLVDRIESAPAFKNAPAAQAA